MDRGNVIWGDKRTLSENEERYWKDANIQQLFSANRQSQDDPFNKLFYRTTIELTSYDSEGFSGGKGMKEVQWVLVDQFLQISRFKLQYGKKR